MSVISNDINKAAEILGREQLVAIPTETVYGLAGNIYSAKAVNQIFAMKQRPHFNPLIVHIPYFESIHTIVEYIPKKAKQLANAFWPGSLTLVLPKKISVPDVVTAGKNTVAVRIPNHPLTLTLLRKLNFPLAAPSANPFGSISPTSAQHVEDYFGSTLPLILDGGICKAGIESTIVGFENDEPVIYRLGSVSKEDIESIIGPIKIKNKKEEAPDAPGMLMRHYAPDTPAFLSEDVDSFVHNNPGKRTGVIVLQNKIDDDSIVQQEVLSATGNLKEAAANLYAALHKLDKLNLDMIVAERMPEEGIGRSINDRLERATKKA